MSSCHRLEETEHNVAPLSGPDAETGGQRTKRKNSHKAYGLVSSVFPILVFLVLTNAQMVTLTLGEAKWQLYGNLSAL